MSALSRPCGAPTPDGRCQHPVSPPAKHCWQHQAGSSTPIIDLDAPWSASDEALWKHGECVLRVVDGPCLFECQVHEQGAWVVAQSLGAEPPCADLRSLLEQALTGHPSMVSAALQPLLEHLRSKVPSHMKSADGRAFKAFFDGAQLTEEQLRKWSDRRLTGHTVTAVAWLEEHRVDPQHWAPLGATPFRIKNLIEAGIDPVWLLAMNKAMWPLATSNWWHTTKTVQEIADMDPVRWAELAKAVRDAPPLRHSVFSWRGSLRDVAAACRRGMGPQDLRQIMVTLAQQNTPRYRHRPVDTSERGWFVDAHLHWNSGPTITKAFEQWEPNPQN